MKRPNPVKLQAEVDAWNSAHKVGADVDLLKDSGEVVRTRTTAAAQVLSGHSAVVWLEGISGCYLLSRCTPVKA